MRIAVTYENGMVFQHFGHTQQMKIYDVENGQITAEQVVDTAGSGHGALAGFLAGLMIGDMKNIIELHCPIVNRLNPAAVLSDAFYCMGIYNDMERFTRCLLILALMSTLLLAAAFLGIRRERYDSI